MSRDKAEVLYKSVMLMRAGKPRGAREPVALSTLGGAESSLRSHFRGLGNRAEGSARNFNHI